LIYFDSTIYFDSFEGLLQYDDNPTKAYLHSFPQRIKKSENVSIDKHKKCCQIWVETVLKHTLDVDEGVKGTTARWCLEKKTQEQTALKRKPLRDQA
jgi:hypothetical protein